MKKWAFDPKNRILGFSGSNTHFFKVDANFFLSNYIYYSIRDFLLKKGKDLKGKKRTIRPLKQLQNKRKHLIYDLIFKSVPRSIYFNLL